MSPYTPTKGDKEQYEKLKDIIFERELSNSEAFDKAILTLSSGLLGLTIAFLNSVVSFDEATRLWRRSEKTLEISFCLVIRKR